MSHPAIPRLVPHANEIQLDPETRSPIDVLRAQTDYWRELTGGEVIGDVERTLSTSDRVAYWFGFVVPALDDYRYRLFLVEHGLDFYPAWVRAGRDDDSPVEVADEAALCAHVAERFRAPTTVSIVRRLHALAREARPVDRAVVGG